jgi:hypothetical protein
VPADVPVADPIAPVEPAPSPPPSVEQRADNVAPPAPPTIHKTDLAVTSPPPAPGVLTAPSIPQARMETVVPPRLSLPIAVKSLITEESFFRLRAELAKDASHRVEIFCRDPSRIGDRLTTACRDLGVRLVIDTAVQQLQKQRVRQPYLLFSDSFTADEWAVFFHNLGYYDRRAEEKKVGDGIFDQLVITPLMPATDQKELFNHIGADLLMSVTRSTPSEDGKAGPKPLIRQALLIPHVPQRTVAPASKEIKQFLDARQERRPNQVAVIVIVKPL